MIFHRSLFLFSIAACVMATRSLKNAQAASFSECQNPQETGSFPLATSFLVAPPTALSVTCGNLPSYMCDFQVNATQGVLARANCPCVCDAHPRTCELASTQVQLTNSNEIVECGNVVANQCDLTIQGNLLYNVVKNVCPCACDGRPETVARTSGPIEAPAGHACFYTEKNFRGTRHCFLVGTTSEDFKG